MNREQFFNDTLEIEILSIALNDAKAVDDIIELKEDVFYNAKNKALYSIIKSLWQQGTEITVATVLSMLKNDLQAVGSVSRVTEVYSSYTTSTGYKKVIEALKEYKERRDLFNLKVKMEKMFEKEKTNNDIIKAVNSEIDNISELTTDDGDIVGVVDELMNVLESKYSNGGKITGIETKLTGLDKRLNGLNKQETIVIAGRPGSGKTTLANNICLRAAAQGKSVAIFNLEMSKIQIFQKLLSNIALIDNEKLKIGNLSDEEWEKVALGQNKLLQFKDNLKVFDSVLDIDKIIAQSRKLKKRNKLDLVVIDYLQLIDGDKKGNREQEISSTSRRLKLLSKELNIPVIVLSQLSRTCETRADKRPMLSDLRESGAIEQDADIVLFCYRDEYYNAQTEDKNILEIIIGKNRNGSTGTERVAWIPQYQKVANLDVRQ